MNTAHSSLTIATGAFPARAGCSRAGAAPLVPRATNAPVALAAMCRQRTQLPRQPTLAAHSSRALAYA